MEEHVFERAAPNENALGNQSTLVQTVRRCVPVIRVQQNAIRKRFDAASVLVRRASLEDVFLILTGRTLED